MPKKFKAENTKAVAARQRKADAHAQAEAKKQKDIEDAYWKDDDKQVQKKQQRKADKEKRRQEELAKKLENKKLLEEEESNLKGPATKPAKLTRAEIEANQQRIAAEKAAAKKIVPPTEAPLEENPNLVLAEEEAKGTVIARDVEEAISALSVREDAQEKHPEKRVKAAYAAYEETNLPILKAENPNLRLSQLKQMLKKDWMKSPENPMNQRFQAYNKK